MFLSLLVLLALKGVVCQYLSRDIAVASWKSTSGTSGCADVTFAMPSDCVRAQPDVGVGPLSAVKLYPFTNGYNPSDLCINNDNTTGCCTATGAYMAILTETVVCSNTSHLLVATAAIPVPLLRTQSISSFQYIGGSDSSYSFEMCFGTTSLATSNDTLVDPSYIITSGYIRKLYVKNGMSTSVEGLNCEICPAGTSIYNSSSQGNTHAFNSTCSEPFLWDAWNDRKKSRKDCYLMTSPTQVLVYVECSGVIPQVIRRFRYFSCIEEADHLLRVAGSVTTRYLRNRTSLVDVVSCIQAF